ncbi:MAG: hypothetical protein ACRD59_03405 [Candidatus Acidiferrales bacterium]
MQAANRKLTTHQKAVLIQVLRSFPEQCVEIRYSEAASDGEMYALEFMSIFKAIGWEVSGPKTGEFPAGGAAGLAIMANEDSGLPACAEALRDGLRIYGIEVETRAGGGRDIAPDRFVLWVGAAGDA